MLTSVYLVVIILFLFIFSVLQARGPKKHLKRLNAPKHWMLAKLTGNFVSMTISFSFFRNLELQSID